MAIIAGASVGYLSQTVLVSLGLHMLVPPVTFTVTLWVTALTVLGLAWPIRSALRGRKRRPVNSRYASRVAVLAKASTVSGALLAGLSGGLSYFALLRGAAVASPNLTALISAVLASLALLLAGLLAEWFCTLPPDDDAEERARG